MPDRHDRAARRDRIRRLLAGQPRVPLAALPTPLEELPRLTEALGGPRVLVKRDDLTGLAFGGNKTRTLEYVLGDVLLGEPDVLVAGASLQSNWCRQASAAAARLGLPIVLVLRAPPNAEIRGNALLDHLLGAEIRLVDEPDMTRVMGECVDSVVAELRAAGRKPAKLDAWSAAAPFGYVGMTAEVDEQFEALGIEPTRIWLSAAGPTQAGLEIGARLLAWSARVTGVAPIAWSDGSVAELTARNANAAAERLGLDMRLAASDIDSLSDHIGPGYHIPSSEGIEAMRLAARTDALVLDPSYTAKAMAGLIEHVRTGRLTRDDTVVFVHTGGLPAVFAYEDAVRAMSPGTVEVR